MREGGLELRHGLLAGCKLAADLGLSDATVQRTSSHHNRPMIPPTRSARFTRFFP